MNVYLETQTRKQVLKLLEIAYQEGYRYVVREPESEYLDCFSNKPKKYMDGEFWGYKEKDLANHEAMPATIIKNVDMDEINWTNRSATPIDKLILIKDGAE